MGRNVSEKTQEIRFTQVLGMASRADKVIAIIEASVNDARNRVESFNRRREAKMALYSSFGLADEQIKGLMAADGLDDEKIVKADLGRVAGGDALIGAFKILGENVPALKHYLSTEAGREFVNDLF